MSGSRVETRRFQALWVDWIQVVRNPPRTDALAVAYPCRGVALQVAFERQTLKPVFHLIGYRFERL
jgi:hypothetical protein